MNFTLRSALMLITLISVLYCAPYANAAVDCSAYSDAELLVYPDVNPVWEMCVRRAADSTPQPNGSGIELFQLHYNGHLVMERANVPVLNVQYGTGGCGCFRDWLDSETVMEATEIDCPNNAYCNVTDDPLTICDCAPSNSCDSDPNNACNTSIGDFTGVGVNKQANYMSINTHTRAGWYRYTVQWFFYLDGVIEPKFKFGATPNGCTDASHMHHSYYRFDFDISGADNDQVSADATSLSGLDDDGDSVDNTLDNCLAVANPSQLDSNGDGFGNACDPDLDDNNVVNFLDVGLFAQSFGTSDPIADFDGSGTVNFLDYAIFPNYIFGPPGPAGEGSSLTDINAEHSAFALANESWTVRDTTSGRGYRITPGPNDLEISNQGGINNPEGFAVADYWVLNEHSNEQTDQGGGCATSLNNYVNGESTEDTDVVFWLRIGSHHEGQDECFCGLNGPRLEPFGDWSAAN